MGELNRKVKIEKAEYHEKWETIYADGDITDEELEEFKTSLKNDGYKVVHVIKGKKV